MGVSNIMLRHALAASAAVCLMSGTAVAACESTPFEDQAGRSPAASIAVTCPAAIGASLQRDSAPTPEAPSWDTRAPSGGEFFDGSARRTMTHGGHEAPVFRSAFGLDNSALFGQVPQPLESPQAGRAVDGWVWKFAGQREAAAAAATEATKQHHASAFRAPGGPVIQILALLMLGAFLLRRTWGR